MRSSSRFSSFFPSDLTTRSLVNAISSTSARCSGQCTARSLMASTKAKPRRAPQTGSACPRAKCSYPQAVGLLGKGGRRYTAHLPIGQVPQGSASRRSGELASLQAQARSWAERQAVIESGLSSSVRSLGSSRAAPACARSCETQCPQKCRRDS